MTITQFDELVNKASTTLKVAHVAGDGLLKVFDASAFPSSGRVTCYQGTGPLSEQVYAILAYSSVDLATNTLTVTGALEGTTDVDMPARTRVEIRGTAGQWNELTAAVNALEESGGGSGSVTSIGLEMPSGLEVSGSPVTDAGTITVATTLDGIVKANGTGFEVATPGTDYLTPADIASIPAASITGTVPVAHGGTGLTSKGTADQILIVKHDGSELTYKSLVAGSNVDLTVDATSVTVAAEVPTLVAGSNITLTPSTGKVTITAADQTYDDSDVVKLDGTQTLTGANTFTQAIDGDVTGNAATADFAHNAHVAETLLGLDPAIFGGELVAIGSSGTGFEVGNPGVVRVAMTVPSGLSVSGSPVTSTGTLAVTTTLSGIVKGDGSGFVEAVAGTDYATPDQIPDPAPTLVAGSNITLTPGSGTVTIAASGGTGTVSSVDIQMPGGLTVSGSPITTSGTIQVTTSLSGMVKIEAGDFLEAAPGTDYATPDQIPTLVAGDNITLTPGTGTITIASTGGTVDTSNFVDLTSNQTITGIKTFGDTAIVSSGTIDKITTSNTELVLEETGDTLGTTRLRLQARAGSTGAVFETATGYAVIDFGFLVGTTQRNIRAEYRNGTYTYAGDNEFQFGSPDAPNFVTSDNGAAVYEKFTVIADVYRTFLHTKAKSATPAFFVYGSVGASRTAITGNATIDGDNYIYGVTSGTSKTLTLPSTVWPGRVIVIKDEQGTAATANITVAAPSGKTIDGAASVTISTNYGCLRIYANDSGNYFTM